jgi:hypothetical protein
MNEHERLQSVKSIRYVLGIIKENAVESGDYRAANQHAILEAISGVEPYVEALMQDASQPLQWNKPRTDTIHLHNGKTTETEVNGLAFDKKSGYILLHGKDVAVVYQDGQWREL